MFESFYVAIVEILIGQACDMLGLKLGQNDATGLCLVATSTLQQADN
jgi:hypothetical protein